jgi:hypothetical protein
MEGPLSILPQFPGWGFQWQWCLNFSTIPLFIVNASRGQERVILIVDEWNELAAATLVDMLKKCDQAA